MRLSEAIRLGAMLHPQCFNSSYLRDRTGKIVATCALGAAEVAGYNVVPLTLALTNGIWLCPVEARHAGWNLGALIAHLNDDHRWTREAIAEFVASLEPPDGEPLSVGAVAGAVG